MDRSVFGIFSLRRAARFNLPTMTSKARLMIANQASSNALKETNDRRTLGRHWHPNPPSTLSFSTLLLPLCNAE